MYVDNKYISGDVVITNPLRFERGQALYELLGHIIVGRDPSATEESCDEIICEALGLNYKLLEKRSDADWQHHRKHHKEFSEE